MLAELNKEHIKDEENYNQEMFLRYSGVISTTVSKARYLSIS
jgi:hypothetical protein